MKGIIAYIRYRGNHGYIRYGEGETAFFHADNVTDLRGFQNLKRHQLVQFELIEGKKGPRAIDVKRFNYED